MQDFTSPTKGERRRGIDIDNYDNNFESSEREIISRSWGGPIVYKSKSDPQGNGPIYDSEDEVDNLSSKSLPSVLFRNEALISNKDIKRIHKRYNPRTFFALQTQKSRKFHHHDDFRQRRYLNKSSFFCCNPMEASYRWWILLTVSFIPFGTYIFYYSISALNTNIKKDMNITDQQLGILYSVSNIANIFMVLLAGVIVDRFGLRRSAFIFNLLVAIGGIVFCLGLDTIKSYYLLLAGRFLFGIGSEAAYVVQDTVTAEWFRGRDISIAMGLATSASGMGEIVSFALLPEMVSLFNSSNLVFWFTGLLCVLCLVSALIYIVLDRRAETETDHEEGEESAEHVHIGMVLKLPVQYWLITGICLTFYAAVFSFMSFGPAFLQKQYGLNQADAGKIISIIGFASTILSPFAGWLLDKVGKHAIVVSFGSLTLGIYFVLFNVSSIPDIYCIGGVVGIGISYAIVSAAIWPCMVAVVDEDIFGTAYGLTTALISLGSMFANWYIGRVFDSSIKTVVLLWSAMAGVGLLLSIIWNVIDSSTGGLANSPADEEDEEVEEEDEESFSENKPLLINENTKIRDLYY